METLSQSNCRQAPRRHETHRQCILMASCDAVGKVFGLGRRTALTSWGTRDSAWSGKSEVSSAGLYYVCSVFCIVCRNWCYTAYLYIIHRLFPPLHADAGLFWDVHQGIIVTSIALTSEFMNHQILVETCPIWYIAHSCDVWQPTRSRSKKILKPIPTYSNYIYIYNALTCSHTFLEDSSWTCLSSAASLQLVENKRLGLEPWVCCRHRCKKPWVLLTCQGGPVDAMIGTC